MSTTTKVFVGNLSFKTKENELAAEFSSAGKVVSANIITRGPRSLGYGFVELENDEAAQKAVQLLNKKTIDGREINVEVAKPRDEAKIAEKKAAAAAAGEGARGRGGRGRGRGRGGAPGARRGGFRGGRGGFRGGRTEGDAASAPAGGAAPAAGGAAPPRPRRRAQKPAGAAKPAGGSSATRTPSQTTLFVANLPFSVDDAGLLEIFKEFNASKAHVVRKRNNRSKGFGFVEFTNAADQEKALAATDKKLVGERELIVKIALTENKTEGATDAAAATPAAPAPAAAATEAEQK
jgi:RNA recognition motif-containing protein